MIKKYVRKVVATSFAVVLGVGLIFPMGSLHTAAVPVGEDETGINLVEVVGDGEDTTSFMTKKESNALLAEAQEYPSAFDLRHVGAEPGEVKDGKTLLTGGKNYVTQVKCQNPWGCCWSFASTSAAETSILFENGVSNEDYEKNNIKELDFSEKMLAWTYFQRVTDADVGQSVSPDQVGEGVDLGDFERTNARYDFGGSPFAAAEIYASGGGPKYEDQYFANDANQYPFQFRGKNGYTQYELFTVSELRESEEGQAACLDLYNTEKSRGIVQDDYETWYDKKIDEFSNKESNVGCSYISVDDWTIPADYNHRTANNAAILEESNVLPLPITRDEESETVTGLNEEGLAAIKKELLNGRPVCFAFHADVSRPGGAPPENMCINTETWAHYSYEDNMAVNHGICVVGYDDNYSKDNFIEGKQPPGDGAFIVKNSWGSADDKTPGNHHKGDEWGYEKSGYFYLSYYDKSVYLAESFDFYTENDEDKPTSAGDEIINQHDFLYQSQVSNFSGDDEATMANVFVAGCDQKVEYISTETETPNTIVDYEVYELNDNSKNPRDGKKLDSGTKTCEWGGIHRFRLNGSYPMAKGTRFSVVMTLKEPTDTGYQYGIRVKAIPADDESPDGIPYTYIGKINKGESLIYENGVWSDWKDYIDKNIDPDYKEKDINIAYDNFPIKAFSYPATKDELSKDLSGAKITLKTSSTDYNGNVQTPVVESVTLDGAAIPASAYTVSITNDKGNAKVSPKDAGSYIVMITGNTSEYYKGSAKTNFKINQVSNTIKFAGKSTKKPLTINVKKSKLKKKAKTFKITKNGKGKTTIKKKVSKKLKKYISLSKGKVILKKKAPKGKYKFTITVAANTNWKKTKTKLITLIVK